MLAFNSWRLSAERDIERAYFGEPLTGTRSQIAR
jgi:hypothetical protein